MITSIFTNLKLIGYASAIIIVVYLYMSNNVLESRLNSEQQARVLLEHNLDMYKQSVTDKIKKASLDTENRLRKEFLIKEVVDNETGVYSIDSTVISF